MPGLHRPLRESDLFLAAGCCRTQKLHCGEDARLRARTVHLVDFCRTVANSPRLFILFHSSALTFPSLIEWRVSVSIISTMIRGIPGERFRFPATSFRFAMTYQGAAPYFFTFHTSHSLWEVRKHGTVARWGWRTRSLDFRSRNKVQFSLLRSDTTERSRSLRRDYVIHDDLEKA